MTANDIRVEAIERIAKEQFAMRRRSSDPDWDDPRPGFAWKWRLHRESAARLVDALGDLLPTGVEKRELRDGFTWQSTDGHGNRTSGSRPCTQQHRFVGSWRNTQASNWLPPARPPLVVERRNEPNKTLTAGPVSLTPLIGEDYWSYRVRLSDKQAIVGFPKFSTVGIGFAVEDDWNTNFPYTTGTEEIFQHIRDNKGDDSISDDDVREAIALIQEAIRADLTLTPVEGEAK